MSDAAIEPSGRHASPQDASDGRRPMLSVIVPVYGVERYLPECVDSILAQTMPGLELILVDDGSPDGCGAICDGYAGRDGRIVVIHQGNAGVSAARNAGLDVARGKYVGFVDPDDWIEPGMYERLVDACETDGCDVAACGFSSRSEDGRLLGLRRMADGAWSGEEALMDLLTPPPELMGSVCNKVFLRKRISSCRFPVGVRMAEDWIFLFSAYEGCRRVRKLGTASYNVRERSGSALRHPSVESQYEIIGSSRALLGMARARSSSLERCAIRKFIDDCIVYGTAMREIGTSTRQPYRRLLWKVRLMMLPCFMRALVLRAMRPRTFLGLLYGWAKL